jgi:periplasmic protein TonB
MSQSTCRMLLGAGLLLCGLLYEGAFLHSQEPAFISGDQAVRFEQGQGFFHYAALCRTATDFKAQMPPARLPREMTESAVCWYVKASTLPAAGGAYNDATAIDGKLVVSAHHVRFVPRDAQFADSYADLHPDQTVIKHEPGHVFASFGTKATWYGFRFSNLCPDCAPGTPVPLSVNAAQLDEEFTLLQNSLKQFDSGWRRIYQLSSKIRVDVRPQNQPGGSDMPEAMRLYSELNRQFAEWSPEPAKSCIRSYAVYEACKAVSGGANCGPAPSCSASCNVSLSELLSLKARACVQLDQQGANLIPDWTDVVRQKTSGRIPIRPLPTGVVEVQYASGANPPSGLGCSAQASYLRASNAGSELAGSSGSGLAVPGLRPSVVAPARPAALPTPKPGIVASARPAAPPAPRASVVVAPKPAPIPTPRLSASTQTPALPAARPALLPAVKPAPIAAPRPNLVTSAKPSSISESKPSAFSSAKAASVQAPRPRTLLSERAPTTVPAPKPSVIASARPAVIPAPRPSLVASAKSSAIPAQKPSPLISAKLNAIPVSKPSTFASAQPAIPSGKSNAFASTRPAVSPLRESAAPRERPAQKQGQSVFRIDPGAATGMLVKKVPPVYPLPAKVARVQGTVVLSATISKTGEIAAVDVVSGPPLLQSAAVDAVKQWQYKPFSVDGLPVEVETTIHVVFGEGFSPARASTAHP